MSLRRSCLVPSSVNGFPLYWLAWPCTHDHAQQIALRCVCLAASIQAKPQCDKRIMADLRLHGDLCLRNMMQMQAEQHGSWAGNV